MNLQDFLAVLKKYPKHSLTLALPDGSTAPAHFHITEIAHAAKTFLDCGGKRHQDEACVLQVWVAHDYDHRVEAGKLAKIIELGLDLFPSTEIPVQFEHEAPVLTRLSIESHSISITHLTFSLQTQKADCMAKDICIPEPNFALPAISRTSETSSFKPFSLT